MTSALDLVLQNPAIWRGNDCARVAVPSVPTGFAELDVALPGGGWPVGALTEIYVERPGIGELQLMMPAVARLTQAGRWITLVAPPYLPYAPALAAHGVKLPRLLLVQTPTLDESLWACEQALRAGGCGAVLAWLNPVHERALKRLQLAAESGGALALLFRSARVIPASPAALRLHISKSESRTVVRILKRRGGLPAPVVLDLHGAVAMRKLTADGRRWTPIQNEESATEITEGNKRLMRDTGCGMETPLTHRGSRIADRGSDSVNSVSSVAKGLWD